MQTFSEVLEFVLEPSGNVRSKAELATLYRLFSSGERLRSGVSIGYSVGDIVCNDLRELARYAETRHRCGTLYNKRFNDERCSAVVRKLYFDSCYLFCIKIFNLREVISSDSCASIFPNLDRRGVLNAFERSFPNLDEARDAICHEHDRALGRFRRKPISEFGQFVRAVEGGIELMDAQGSYFRFSIRLHSVETLIDDLLLLLSI